MKIVGVDLGTTNSCVYYLDDAGNPQLATAQKLYKFLDRKSTRLNSSH